MSGGQWLRDRPVPSFAQLCVLVHHIFDRLGGEAVPSDAVDEAKWDLARAGLGYPPTTQLVAAVDAVRLAREKGYRTPRQPRRKPAPPSRRAS